MSIQYTGWASETPSSMLNMQLSVLTDKAACCWSICQIT